MPNRSASRASGLINPSEGLSFSGAAVVIQQQTSASALKQTTDPATFEATGAAQTGDGFSAGLLAANAPGLLTPLEPSTGIASSVSAADGPTPVSTAEGAAPEPPSSDCDTSVSELYCVYEVQKGDTLSSIADLFGLESTDDFVNWELLVHSNNSVVVNPDDVAPGLKLIIPLGNGTIHTVLTAETLTDIADQYGVTVEEIISVPGNGLTDPNAVGIGTEILIPNPTRFAPVFVPDISDAGDDDSEGSTESGSGGPSEPAITGGGPSSSAGFIWPAGGPISSYYGPNHPLGIDIDLFNNGGAPISAAMGGVVTFAGGNACCSYGYYVVVDHGNGFQTLYAHLSAIGVGVGEVVAQGQYLGAGGSTGYSTGDHLHFEVQLNGSRVNPLNYLP